MPVDLEDAFVVGISSRALFDLVAEQEIFEKDGLEAYTQYQLEHENDVLTPGTGFPLVEAMLSLNTLATLQRKIIVVVMSKNNAETSIRISKSIKHYNLDIIRGAYTSGEPLHRYLGAFHVDLLLSASKTDVQSASDAGFAAGLIYPYRREDNLPSEGLRIAPTQRSSDLLPFGSVEGAIGFNTLDLPQYAGADGRSECGSNSPSLFIRQGDRA